MSRFMPGETEEMVIKEMRLERLRFMAGNKTQTASSLGIAVNTLDNALKKYKEEEMAQFRNDEMDSARDRDFMVRARGPMSDGIYEYVEPDKAPVQSEVIKK